MAKLNEELKTAEAVVKAAIFNAQDTLDGFEEIGGRTMAIPFVRILQKLSAQLNKQKQEFIDGAEEGDWFNTTTKVYGPEVNVIVLKFERVYIEWKVNRGGFVNYHSPENAERLAVDTTWGNWKTKEGNELAETYMYMCLIEGQEAEGVVVISFSSSAIKVAREWNHLMTTHIMDDGKRAKPYYLVWKLSTDYRENDQGSWYSPKVKFLRYISEAQYAVAGHERLALPSKKVDYAQLDSRLDSDSLETSTY